MSEKKERAALPAETAEMLMAEAEKARARAYAPYSGFSVGAALLFEDGSVVSGCNVENASYSLSICAERNAMTTAVAMGLTRPTAAAVSGPDGVFCPPCGSCRQVLLEMEQRYSRDIRIHLCGAERIYTLESVKGLLPLSFADKSMR